MTDDIVTRVVDRIIARKIAKEQMKEHNSKYTYQHCKELCKLICSELDIAVPSIHWSGHVKNGKARKNSRTIFIGPNVWHDLEAICLHELAHIYKFTEEIRKPYLIDRSRKRSDDHGELFQTCLLRIVRIWYGIGNEYKYDWQNEYPRIRKNAIAKGYHKPKEK